MKLVSIEPSSHVGILVGGVGVEDHMHGFARRHLLDRVEEANKVLMTMALHIASDHGSFDLVEGGKQHCGTVALVVVGHCSSTPLILATIKLPKNGQCRASVERVLPSSACYV